MTTLGIDPGVTGAAVLLDRFGNFEACWKWTPKRMKSSTQDVPHDAESLGEMMFDMASDAADGRRASVLTVCIEGLYIPPDHKRPQDLLTLAEAAGKAIGACEAAGLTVAYRPKASTWRSKTIKAACGKSRKQAEAYALEHVGAFVELPEPWNTNIHVVEAALIARYGHIRAIIDARKAAG